jgi:hypothetical protein
MVDVNPLLTGALARYARRRTIAAAACARPAGEQTQMAATILEFRSDVDRVPGKPTRRRRRSAEIVIFPGVRYERHETPPAAKTGSDTGVERDTLKLVD